MFLTRNVTAEIFSTFTAHLSAATDNFAPDANQPAEGAVAPVASTAHVQQAVRYRNGRGSVTG